MYSQWQSIEAYEAMRRDPRLAADLKEALTIAKFEPSEYVVVETFAPDAGI